MGARGPLTAFTNGTLVDSTIMHENDGAGDASGCGGPPFHTGSGAGDGFKSDVVYAADGSRVAVLLLTGRTASETGFARAAEAASSLYCAG